MLEHSTLPIHLLVGQRYLLNLEYIHIFTVRNILKTLQVKQMHFVLISLVCLCSLIYTVVIVMARKWILSSSNDTKGRHQAI
jgi:hypothetical protein